MGVSEIRRTRSARRSCRACRQAGISARDGVERPPRRSRSGFARLCLLLWRWDRHGGATEVVDVRGAVGTGNGEAVTIGAQREVATVGGHVQRMDVLHLVAFEEPY